MNNGKYHTQRYKELQEAKVDRKFGPVKIHTKECKRCGKEFTIEGREKTRKVMNANFCSRSCSNNRQEWWNDNAINYRTIALQQWEHKCAICGFDKIVAIHHIDENHDNNNPHNLIPLCPNHHEMVHSKWRTEVQPIIDKLVIERLGD